MPTVKHYLIILAMLSFGVLAIVGQGQATLPQAIVIVLSIIGSMLLLAVSIGLTLKFFQPQKNKKNTKK